MSPTIQSTSQEQRSAKQQRLFDFAIWLGLILSTLAVYAQVRGFDFVYWDDDRYVYENPHIRAGLTVDSIRWAFASVVVGNWAPVTLISHQLTVELFGMNSGIHHLVNVLFAVIAAILLYEALYRATGARWPSAFVAFVFALHPLHVESVAWVAERKDVLSAVFWFLAFYFYVRYTERPSPGGYALVAAAFCLGLLSKATLVTFPFTLILLDIWPLRRTQWRKNLWEKLALIALSGAVAAVTYAVQKTAGAVQPFALTRRVANAIISYVTYIGQTFWPVRLACFYPAPDSIPPWKVVLAAAAILGVSVLALLAVRTRPYVTTGWFWYLGTLVPVIGIVQVGTQAHADRYMYIPMVGLSVILAWGAADMVAKWPRTKRAVAAAGILSCAACMAAASVQAGHWRNTETLYQQAIDVTQNNFVAEYNLGTYLGKIKRPFEAMPHLEAALSIQPDNAPANYNLGLALVTVGYYKDAVPYLQTALRVQPDYPGANGSLGDCALRLGNFGDAITQFEKAVRLDPDSTFAYFNLGMSLSKVPDRAQAGIEQYEAVLRSAPADWRAHITMGGLLAGLGRIGDAISHMETAKRIHPDPAVSKILADLAGPR